jgi:hypothetical protein
MSLDNLARIGQLRVHTPSAAETLRLIASAERNLKDAHVAGLSDETRFNVGYNAIMQCALVALMASGYRPSTNMPGHHQTMIQSLPLTLGVTNDDWLVLDALRKKRNVNDYAGGLIDPESVRECIARAAALLATTRRWLKEHHPQLLERHK